MTNIEYSIFITCKGGKTYNLSSYSSISEVKNALYNMIQCEKMSNRPYYVYNEFYNNEYPSSLNCKIFCIKKRVVSEWEKYEENKHFNNINNNIINFPKKFEIYY